MTNLFVNFQNGTFESGSTSSLVNTPVPANGSVFSGGRSTTAGIARTGTGYYRIRSNGGAVLTEPQRAPNYVSLSLRTQYTSSHNGLFLAANKRYLLESYVLNVPTNPLMNADCWVAFGNANASETLNAFAFKGAPDVNGVCKTTVGSGSSSRVFSFIKASDLAAYKKLSYEWTEQAPDSQISIPTIYILVSSAAGTALLNTVGEVALDDTTIFEVLVCTLQPDPTPYIRVNESAEGANDGQIALRSLFGDEGIKEYSLDGINWQLSNAFLNLAPGTYTGYVRVNGIEGCQLTIPNIPIAAFNPVPPPVPPVVPSGALVVDKKPVNYYNFINWFNSFGKIGYTKLQYENCDWDFPNRYAKRDNSNVFPAIVEVGEMFSFYINFFADQNYLDFNNLKVAIGNEYGVKLTDIATLTKNSYEGGLYYNILSEVTLPSLAAGKYFLIIYNYVTSDIVWTSSWLEVMRPDTAKKVSVRLQYRNGNDIYRFLYTSEAAENFLNTIRVRCNLIEENTEGELTQYREVSSGALRNVSLELDKFIVLEMQYFSRLMHRAASILPAHNILLINGIQYVCKSLYKETPKKELNATFGVLEVYEQQFSTANRFNSIEPIVIVGSEDNLIEANGGFIKY